MSNFDYTLNGNFNHDVLVVDEFLEFLKDLKARTFITHIYDSATQTADDIENAFHSQSGVNVAYPIGAKTFQFNPTTQVISKVHLKIDEVSDYVSLDDDSEHSAYVVYSKKFLTDTADNFDLIDFTNIPDFDATLMFFNLRGARAAVPEAVWLNFNLLATDYANIQTARVDGSVSVATFERQANRYIPSQKVPEANANNGYFIQNILFGMGHGRADVTSAGMGLAQYIVNNALTSGAVNEYGVSMSGYATNTAQKMDRFHWRNVTGTTGLAKGSSALILGLR